MDIFLSVLAVAGTVVVLIGAVALTLLVVVYGQGMSR